MPDIRTRINLFCKKIGRDRLLVQGAGGNISWKDGGVIWIKASGKWLSKADEDIFVDLDFLEISKEIQQDNYSPSLNSISRPLLRPSIETILHCLFPYKYVLHLHPVDILTDLIKKNAKFILQKNIGDKFSWGYVEYCRPGDELASAVHKELILKGAPKIIFLKNHGVVLADDSLSGLEKILSFLIESFSRTPNNHRENIYISSEDKVFWDKKFEGRYTLIDPELSLLATYPEYYSRAKNSWAICPDHVVYLGAMPICLDKRNESFEQIFSSPAPFIFVNGVGVYGGKNFTSAQLAQLNFYLDVVSRLNPADEIDLLSYVDIGRLLNWDAEKYRVAINDV